MKQKVRSQSTLTGEIVRTERPDPRNPLNELSNREWMFFTRSVWFTSIPRELGFELRNKHGGNKPPSLMKLIIEFFTKKNGTVLDPMCGVGGTLLGASLCERKALGIEINEKWLDIYRKVCKMESIKDQETILGDCLQEMARMRRTFDFVVVDPPYRETTLNPRISGVRKQAMANGEKMTSLTESFSDEPGDFGNSGSLDEYTSRLDELFALSYRALKEGKYLVVFSKDEYRDGEFAELSSLTAQRVRTAGFKWVGKITWAQSGAPLRPYGLPFTYVPNFIDQKILIFKKGNGSAPASTSLGSSFH